LLIQGALLLLGDMPAVLACHGAFFPANLAVLTMQFCGLTLADFTFPALLVDSAVLIFETIIHLVATGMILGPLTLSRQGRTYGCANKHRQQDDRQQFGHGISPYENEWAFFFGLQTILRLAMLQLTLTRGLPTYREIVNTRAEM
jgi:hypothetical protein